MKREKTGFSLIEIIIYVALVSIIAVSFVVFIIDVTTSSQKARVRQEVQQNARFAFQRITREIRAADDVNAGSSAFGTSPGVLSLAADNPTDDPTVFSVNGGVLQITQGANPAQDLTSDRFVVTNLVFTDLSVNNRTKNIMIELTLEHPNPQDVEVFDASSTYRGAVVIRSRSD